MKHLRFILCIAVLLASFSATGTAIAAPLLVCSTGRCVSAPEAGSWLVTTSTWSMSASANSTGLRGHSSSVRSSRAWPVVRSSVSVHLLIGEPASTTSRSGVFSTIVMGASSAPQRRP